MSFPINILGVGRLRKNNQQDATAGRHMRM